MARKMDGLASGLSDEGWADSATSAMAETRVQKAALPSATAKIARRTSGGMAIGPPEGGPTGPAGSMLSRGGAGALAIIGLGRGGGGGDVWNAADKVA